MAKADISRLLWITWLITTVFDARFGQDGVLERVARACHLGVMLGFSVVAVVFNEPELIRPIFKATCKLGAHQAHQVGNKGSSH